MTTGAISLVVSVIAVLVSGLALYKSWRTQTRQIELTEKQSQLEEIRERDRLLDRNKARLTARIDHKSDSGKYGPKYFLVIENKGQADARNTTIGFGETLARSHPILPLLPEEEIRVGALSRIELELAAGYKRHVPLNVHISWDDDSGEMGHHLTTLTAPL